MPPSTCYGVKTFLYNYQTTVRFNEPVGMHHVMLRCQPAANDFQQLEEEHLILPPLFHLRKSRDVYGNRIIYGGTLEDHSTLAYVSSGIVKSRRYAIRSEAMRPFYGIETTLTAASEEMRTILPPLSGSIETRAMEICHLVHTQIEYVPDSTTVVTPAAVVLAQRKGVCQDMAHLMITLCRLAGITARYVNGFLVGEGVTHAWVEVYDNGTWIGIDPTHDRLIDYGYIKIAHGRDVQDCPVNRGTYLGNVIQTTNISVSVVEI